MTLASKIMETCEFISLIQRRTVERAQKKKEKKSKRNQPKKERV